MAKQTKQETEKKTKKAAAAPAKNKAESTVKVDARLASMYREEIIPKLKEKFGYSNIMEVPKLEKIVVNMGVGDAVQDSKLLDEAVKELETITGQKSFNPRSKKIHL